MATLTDLGRRLTPLTEPDIDWLHALVSDWQLLADLSFADLVLWAPLRDGSGWVALAQMRPTTGPTTFLDDLVGTCAGLGDRPFVYAAYHEKRICREGDPEWTGGIPVRRESIPVVREGAVIAVIERSTNLSSARTPSRRANKSISSTSKPVISRGLFGLGKIYGPPPSWSPPQRMLPRLRISSRVSALAGGPASSIR